MRAPLLIVASPAQTPALLQDRGAGIRVPGPSGTTCAQAVPQSCMLAGISVHSCSSACVHVWEAVNPTSPKVAFALPGARSLLQGHLPWLQAHVGWLGPSYMLVVL